MKYAQNHFLEGKFMCAPNNTALVSRLVCARTCAQLRGNIGSKTVVPAGGCPPGKPPIIEGYFHAFLVLYNRNGFIWGVETGNTP